MEAMKYSGLSRSFHYCFKAHQDKVTVFRGVEAGWYGVGR